MLLQSQQAGRQTQSMDGARRRRCSPATAVTPRPGMNSSPSRIGRTPTPGSSSNASAACSPPSFRNAAPPPTSSSSTRASPFPSIPTAAGWRRSFRSTSFPGRSPPRNGRRWRPGFSSASRRSTSSSTTFTTTAASSARASCRKSWSSSRSATGPRWSASSRPAGSTSTSSAPTWCATWTASSSSWRTTAGARPASATCWKTAS